MKRLLLCTITAILLLNCFLLSISAESTTQQYIQGEFIITTAYDWDDNLLQEKLSFLPEHTAVFMMRLEATKENVYHVILKDRAMHDEIYELLNAEKDVLSVQLNYIYSPATPVHRKGDINVDDSIDSTDLILLKKYLLGQTTFDAIEYSCADIDNNDEINVTDYLFIKRSQLKISTISDDGYYLGEDISVYRQYPDKELEARIKNDYLDSIEKSDKYTEDQVVIKNFMGSFNDCYIMKIATSDAEALAVITEETVANVKFINRTSQKLVVWNDGNFYTLSDAYDKQLLTEKDVIIASKLYYNLDPELKFES